MNSDNIAQRVREEATRLGFDAVGFAKAEPVSDEASRSYSQWIEARHHGSMAYMERYDDVRRDPRLLLHGARTVIALALNYYPAVKQDATAPLIAYYAYGRDYHEVVRQRGRELAEWIAQEYGAESRVCVDTAPLRERYWAQRAGLGFIGRNNALIIPGRGSWFFLGFLITTLEVEPSKACKGSCGSCRRCVESCPASALSGDGAVDAQRCLSCLTIENREERLPEGTRLGRRLYGCDTCQVVCPHNSQARPTTIPEFQPSEAILHLTDADVAALTDERFRELFRHSAVRRVKPWQLQRNLRYLDPPATDQ